MATKTQKVFLLRSVPHEYETASLTDWSLSDPEYLRLGVADAVFDMESESEQVQNAIKGLQAAKKREMAESQARLNAYDARIQSLLAITHEA